MLRRMQRSLLGTPSDADSAHEQRINQQPAATHTPVAAHEGMQDPLTVQG